MGIVSSLFMLQLSYLNPEEAQVRVTHSPAGEWHYTMGHPFDPVSLRGLLQVLEKRDLDRCQLEEVEAEALRRLGLIEGGRLVGPFGEREEQSLLRIRRTGPDTWDSEVLGRCRFVDLVGAHGWAA